MASKSNERQMVLLGTDPPVAYSVSRVVQLRNSQYVMLFHGTGDLPHHSRQPCFVRIPHDRPAAKNGRPGTDGVCGRIDPAAGLLQPSTSIPAIERQRRFDRRAMAGVAILYRKCVGLR